MKNFIKILLYILFGGLAYGIFLLGLLGMNYAILSPIVGTIGAALLILSFYLYLVKKDIKKDKDFYVNATDELIEEINTLTEQFKKLVADSAKTNDKINAYREKFGNMEEFSKGLSKEFATTLKTLQDRDVRLMAITSLAHFAKRITKNDTLLLIRYDHKEGIWTIVATGHHIYLSQSKRILDKIKNHLDKLARPEGPIIEDLTIYN